MKKLTALLLSVVLVLSLAACGSANKPASSTTQPETSAPTEQPATEPSESSSTAPAESEPETQPETGKTLVVYYSVPVTPSGWPRILQRQPVPTSLRLFPLKSTPART